MEGAERARKADYQRIISYDRSRGLSDDPVLDNVSATPSVEGS
jgi:hypothetical protein